MRELGLAPTHDVLASWHEVGLEPEVASVVYGSQYVKVAPSCACSCEPLDQSLLHACEKLQVAGFPEIL